MTSHRTSAVILVVLVVLTGCGGGTAKRAGLSTSPTHTSSTTQVSPTSAPASPAPTVTITTKEGYVYQLQAQPPRTTPTLTLGLNVKNAPPGQDYIVFDVTMTSGLTDRPEPLYVFGDPRSANQESQLQVAVPTADLAKFGLASQDCSVNFTVGTSPPGWCILGTYFVSWAPDPDNPTTPQLYPKQPETLVIALESTVPQSASLARVALFAVVSGHAPTRVPWQR